MTRNDIIAMAREAGSIDSEDVIETVYAAFAAAEREACAQVCEKTDVVVYRYVVELHDDGHATLRNAAAAIRARGEK